jgi:hypothetical protein
MNPIEKRRSIYQTLQKIVSLDKIPLFQFTLLAIIAKAVDPKPIDLIPQYDDLNKLYMELSILLAFVIKSGHKTENDELNTYKSVMLKYFPNNKIPMPPVMDFEPVLFEKILQKLNSLSPLCKEKLIKACLECIEIDKKILVEEAEIVRAIGACLDCPIPPIVPNA